MQRKDEKRGNLAIRRREGQSVWIGESKITIVSIHADYVRLAIEADKSVYIFRDEILAARREAEHHSTQLDPPGTLDVDAPLVMTGGTTYTEGDIDRLNWFDIAIAVGAFVGLLVLLATFTT